MDDIGVHGCPFFGSWMTEEINLEVDNWVVFDQLLSDDCVIIGW